MSFETLFAMVVLVAAVVIVSVGVFGRSNKKKYRAEDKGVKPDDNSFLIDDNDVDLGDSSE